MNKRATFVNVTTTLDRPAAARRLARRIVEERLAACAQWMPIRSTYWWKGRVEHAREWRLTAKTRAALAPRLIRRIRDVHPYDLPEIVVTPIASGLPEYLAWIATETAAARPPRKT